MALINSSSFKMLAVSITMLFIAAVGVVALTAQQGPPQGGGQGMMGRPGGPGGPGGRGPGMFGMGPGGRGPMGGLMIRGLGQLNLTDEQKTQIKAAMESHKDDFKAFAEKTMAAHVALQDAITADKVDEGAIRARVAEAAAVEADAAVLRAQVHAQVFALLTPDQQAKARQLEANAKKHMGPGAGRGGRGGGRGPGRGPGRGGWASLLSWL